MSVKPKCEATAIGSMPHATAEAALDVIFGAIPNAPIWPQLSARGLYEQMEIQYSEGLPRVVVDEEKERMYFDTTGDYSEELAEFYEGYMTAEEEGDCSCAAISEKYSAGIPALEARLKDLGKKRPFVKVQTTGPVSFALTIVDENKKAIFYNEEFVDTVVKGLTMKCRWQIQKFKGYGENIICFVDEPILSAFGSSTYVSVQREDVVDKLNEVSEAIKAEGALSAVHVCGNSEWSILVDAGLNILNFDAFEYGETVALYPEHMKTHLVDNGNAIAWGLIPTSTAIRDETVEGLVGRFEEIVDHVAEKTGIDRQLIVEQSFITPSCGTGSMEVADSELVFKTLGEVSRALKGKYGF
jgi:hypothetical protein